MVAARFCWRCGTPDSLTRQWASCACHGSCLASCEAIVRCVAKTVHMHVCTSMLRVCCQLSACCAGAAAELQLHVDTPVRCIMPAAPFMLQLHRLYLQHPLAIPCAVGGCPLAILWDTELFLGPVPWARAPPCPGCTLAPEMAAIPWKGYGPLRLCQGTAAPLAEGTGALRQEMGGACTGTGDGAAAAGSDAPVRRRTG
jgi:hypothetical protein